jgi:hypothetical protein
MKLKRRGVCGSEQMFAARMLVNRVMIKPHIKERRRQRKVLNQANIA